MADASRFPQGLILGSTAVMAPVGTIKQDPTGGQLMRSLSATVASFASLPGGFPSTTIADPGTGVAIPVTQSGHINIVTAGVETNTLAAPTFVGQILSMVCQTFAGNRTITCATGVNQAVNTTVQFTAADQWILLLAVSINAVTLWRIFANDSVTIAP